MQLTHYNNIFRTKRHPITLICDNISYAPNVGGLFRLTDSYNIEELIFCGDDNPVGKRITKTSRSTEKYVSYKIETDMEKVIHELKETHYLIALEITETSKSLRHYQIETLKPLAVIVGNENYGISETVLKSCDEQIHIEMFGQNSSMNVVNAASILLYELSKQMSL